MTRVVVVVAPQVHFVEVNAIVGIGVCYAAGHGPRPGFTDTVNACDAGCRGREVITGANVERHIFDRLTCPWLIRQVHLIGPRPGGGQIHFDGCVFASQKIRHCGDGADQFVGITRILSVQRAVAVHDHLIKRASSDNGQLVFEVKVYACATAGLQIDVVIQTGLFGERLKQRWHSTDAFVVEIGHR